MSAQPATNPDPRLVAAIIAALKKENFSPALRPIAGKRYLRERVFDDISDRAMSYLMNQPWFPAPVQAGPRLSLWNVQEVVDAFSAHAPRRLSRPEPEVLRAARERAAKSALTVTAP
jgi:hypothetical protein